MAFLCSPASTPELVRRRRRESRETPTNRAGRIGSSSKFRRRSDSQMRTVVAIYLTAIRPGDLRMGDQTLIYGTRTFWTTADERTLGALPVLIARADVDAPLCLPALPWNHMQADLLQVGQCLEILAGWRTEYYVGKKDTPWTEAPMAWVEPYCRRDVFRPTESGLRLPAGWIRRVCDVLRDLDATYHLSCYDSMRAWWNEPEAGQKLLQEEIVGPLRKIGWPVEQLPALRSLQQQQSDSAGQRRRRKKSRKRKRAPPPFTPPRYWFTASWEDRRGTRGADALRLCVRLFQSYLPSIKTPRQRSIFETRIETYRSLAAEDAAEASLPSPSSSGNKLDVSHWKKPKKPNMMSR